MKSYRVFLRTMLLVVTLVGVVWAQDTASITGTVTDKTGAAVPNAKVTISNPEHGLTRSAATNGAGDFLFAALPIGSYDVTVVAEGFKKYQAKALKLDVAEKARVNVTLEVGAVTTEVIVQGSEVAEVQTQSSDLGGTINGKEVTQLELNGRDFKQLVTLVPGVSNQTGADEGGVGVTANNQFSVNGGRVEYNNWELDGGDNLDNGSNGTLNVTPSIDAIGEFKVLTSNYGAQYGKNGSGTIEVETKSGTNRFHGDAYEFVRNNAFNSPSWNEQGVAPPYHKNDYGYTVGGPVYIPHVYNTNKQKTFFFWSQEWRRDRVPYTFDQLVPTAAERSGNFTDQCPNVNPTIGYADCPIVAGYTNASGYTPNLNVLPKSIYNPADPNAQALLSLIPPPTQGLSFANPTVPGLAAFYQVNSQPTNWRQELLRVDHNFTNNERISFHYIHDSWFQLQETPLWTNAGNFPTIQTNFNGPGVSYVARLASTFTPTLLNEFVFSYTTDHIALTNIGDVQRPSNTTFGSIFPGADRGIMPGINLLDPAGVYGNFGEDAGYIPQGPYNSNPTYSMRDNVNKLIGKHNLQIGAYFQAVEKNELGGELAAGSFPGYITFNPSCPATAPTTGNPFADLLLGDICSFGQQNTTVKYYNRYKMLEPYFNDDWHLTSRLTLNLGVRVSLFGTYREKEHQAFNFDPAFYVAGQTSVDPNTDYVTKLTKDNNPPTVSDLPNGIVQCGVTPGVPVGCMTGHLFNPAPRVGFAWDPRGDGKYAIRGGYGIFFEHGNGNEANTESLENSPPLAYAAQQYDITGYPNIGTGTAAAQLPLGVTAIPTKAQWPYVQQWHLDLQHELARNTVGTLSYVGSKGTRLTRLTDLNQLYPATPNPYTQGQTFTGNECNGTLDGYDVPTNATTPSGAPIPYAVGANGIPYGPAVNVAVAVGCVPAGADPFRPYPGYGSIADLQTAASSNYNALQFLLRRSAGGLELDFAYTYSHSIDDSSDRYDASFTNTYNPAANRASSNFDERQIINASYIWDIPVFKGRGLTHTLLGGWEYSGIMNFNTGSPFSVIYNAVDNAGVGNGQGSTAYADIIGNPSSTPHTINQYGRLFYNPSAYTTPTALTFGDSARNSLSNPDFINFNMALFKHFALKESTALEFRAEAFNIFNHAEWLPIAGQGGSGANISGTYTNVYPAENFLFSGGLHEARVLQLALKFLF